MNYQDYLNSDAWKTKALEVKTRDGFRCILCGAPDSLEVHHTTYQHFKNEKLSELMTLCHECHKLISLYQWTVKFNQEMEATND